MELQRDLVAPVVAALDLVAAVVELDFLDVAQAGLAGELVGPVMADDAGADDAAP